MNSPRQTENGLEAAISSSGRSFDPAGLERLLALRYGGAVGDLICGITTKPLSDLIGRPGKRIRGRLVEIGYELGRGQQIPAGDPVCRRLMDAIESLHAGSLAVDDLQDGSRMRRGAPSLHVKYGVPIAVNIGNLLYFWTPEIVAELDLDAERELKMHRLYHRTMVRAHLGQAMDVGIPIDTLPQARVPEVCFAAMELKSGALFSLALLFGALAGGASDGLVDVIDEFGHGFGIGLQMFDDIGNIRGVVEPAKRWEDLLLRRPTWIWACAARHFSKDIYGDFVHAVHQLSADDRHPLETWFEQHGFLARATRLAQEHLNASFEKLESRVQPSHRPAVQRLRALGAEIARAYE
ncbi:MAG: polyprenyl synthetase family protein [Elusimicrobia bacterium]|nr:polyprenyl synthetase family protein [Elusimicrobiota bacterium]